MTDTFQHGRGENINLLSMDDCLQSFIGGKSTKG